MNNTSLLSSSVRIKAFCPNNDRSRLLRKNRQEKSIMALRFDNILQVFTDNGDFSPFPLCLLCLDAAYERDSLFSQLHLGKESGKNLTGSEPLQRGPSGSLVITAWGLQSVNLQSDFRRAQGFCEPMEMAGQMLYLGHLALSLGANLCFLSHEKGSCRGVLFLEAPRVLLAWGLVHCALWRSSNPINLL